MNVRRAAAVLAAAAVLGAGSAPAALADDATPAASPSAPPEIPAGLHGAADPTYDGVWRQSLALLAQDTAGVTPSGQAVRWLTGQQCADGSFAAFRPDPAKDCDAGTMVDSNSTAAAVQALAALGGHDAAVGKAVDWLVSVQNKDGGWGYSPGTPSDANSTSVVIGALAAAGEKPAETVKGGKSPLDALLTFALPCEGEDAGAFAYQPDKSGELLANADATAAAVLGSLGAGLGGKDAEAAGSPAECGTADTPGQAAQNGAAYLAGPLQKDGHLTSALPGADPRPDLGNTADAVIALASAGHADQARKAFGHLRDNGLAWAEQTGPAAYAQLVLAAEALGTDPRDFGGEDLVKLLNSTGPAPEADAAHGDDAAEGGEEKADGSGISPAVWWAGGGVLALIVVVAVLLTVRKRRP
ncbi:prenyltransferase/squalene oxidase repeat-containing protein [Streptomyces abyssomicinicus]|uniref:prenyltransferase/squalene oxidase repeat-containing protein n=1 Tax=Streptomyces abyssomicinicus TaxID=574929 RepID=UPI0012504264|nr:prenyltransferase/squalene oxidase repeat-containing protein [Streptomyces abyssomicinicus]